MVRSQFQSVETNEFASTIFLKNEEKSDVLFLNISMIRNWK